jgi:hypothetical protein
MSHCTTRHPRRLAWPLVGLLLAGTSLAGCAKKIDKLTVNRVVARALTVPDVDQSCEIGVSLRSPLAAATKAEKPARQALLISEATAAMCDEMAAWTHELDRAKAMSDAIGYEPAQRARLARDAGYAADRSHQRAAARYHRAWVLGLEEFGNIGEGDCPKLKSYEEFSYFITLVSGMQSVLHDSQSGRTLGIPQETILNVARGARCLMADPDKDGTVDGKKWWYAPEALQAAAWATIPGSGPPGFDAWAVMEDMGTKGDTLGVRVARGLQVTIAVNAGKEDVARTAIQAHAKANADYEQSPTHALLDRYAYLLSLHQSDLLWIAEEGHRTPVFGELPGTPAGDSGGGDPFGEDAGGDPFGGDAGGGDPFASDPPAAPPTDGDSPAQEGGDTESPAQEPR